MFEKLKEFKQYVGHCKVPKGYAKDPELANWVRNQRLEHANMIKGKRSRMTDERFQMLDAMGFKWSTTMPSKKPASSAEESTPAAKEDSAKTSKETVDETPAPELVKKEESTDVPKVEPTPEAGKVTAKVAEAEIKPEGVEDANAGLACTAEV